MDGKSKPLITVSGSLKDAISKYDRGSDRDKIDRAEAQRAEALQHFPLDHWPDMTLEEYALGQDEHEDNFCRWMEFLTQDLGSIRGGSARKLIIYKHKNKAGWYFPKMFDDEKVAWEHLRADFVQAFEHARRSQWRMGGNRWS